MFTGIVQSIGVVKRAGKRLLIEGKMPYEIPAGGSVAVNGCCLTHRGGEMLSFDISDETLSRTTLGGLAEGYSVNLEAALRAGDPIGGHFVLGHVDSVGELVSRGEEAFEFRAPAEAAEFLADKGSITVDGVSLTVVGPRGGSFRVALVPHTLERTTLGELQPGGKVNLEYDIFARYIGAMMHARASNRAAEAVN